MAVPDKVLGVVFALAGVGVAGMATRMETMMGLSVGPGLLPLIVGVGFILFGGMLAWQGAARPAVASPAVEKDGLSGWRAYPLVVVAGLLAFILLLPHIGFVPLAILFVFAVTRAGGASWAGAALFAVLITIAIYLLFVDGLHVPLPRGLLG